VRPTGLEPPRNHKVHKALNLARVVSVVLPASESSKLCGSVDGLDELDGMDVATGVVTPSLIGGAGPTGVCMSMPG
jgi:hypothetical protein